jgi:hypothetical protein
MMIMAPPMKDERVKWDGRSREDGGGFEDVSDLVQLAEGQLISFGCAA